MVWFNDSHLDYLTLRHTSAISKNWGSGKIADNVTQVFYLLPEKFWVKCDCLTAFSWKPGVTVQMYNLNNSLCLIVCDSTDISFSIKIFNYISVSSLCKSDQYTVYKLNLIYSKCLCLGKEQIKRVQKDPYEFYAVKCSASVPGRTQTYLDILQIGDKP